MSHADTLALVVVQLSESFSALWQDVADELGVPLIDANPADIWGIESLAVIVGAGGEEDRALDLLRELDHDVAPRAALWLLGDIPLGRQQAKRALQIARAHDDPLAEIEAQRILGNLECIAQQYQPAERLMRRAQRLATKIGHPWAMAEVWRDTGTLFMRMEKTDKAAACFGFAAEAFVRIGAKRRASAMRRRIRGISPK